MIKVVFVGGPVEGKVTEVKELVSEIICVAIPRRFDWSADPEDYDPYAPVCDTAHYRRKLRPTLVGDELYVAIYVYEGTY